MHVKKVLALALLLGAAAANADTTVAVQIAGISGNEGQIVVSVYDNKKDWLKRPVMQEVVSGDEVAEDGTMTVELSMPTGEYAVHVYHDRDANGKMKANFIGIPREPTGVSNDAKGKMGPPKFKDAAFAVADDPVELPINMVQI